MAASLIALLTALLIDLALGDPPNRFHPVVAMGSVIRLGDRLAGDGRPAGRFLCGLGILLLGAGLFGLPWLALPGLIHALPVWLQGILQGLLLKPMFSLRRLLEAGRAVQCALEQGTLGEARQLVAWHLVSRDTSQLSAGQVSSAAIESLAENLTDSFFAPLLAFALGGLPLAWFYRFCNTADAMIGYHTPRYEYLGKPAARLDDALNWLPARLAGLFLVAAAGLCRESLSGAWRGLRRDHARTSSPNAGWTMAAAAGALGVRLEKIGHYCLAGGENWPTPGDISRASRMILAAAGLAALFCGGVADVIHLFI
jgi:adenosylcobinamide-phosphate synthase